MTDTPLLDAVDRIHARVQSESDALARLHAERLHCRQGCAGCCTDELTVLSVEADAIRRRIGARLAGAAPGAPGACVFLDATGSCRIYAARPWVCRTQGLPLRWFEEDEDEEIVEHRDICPLNLAGPSLALLPDDALWTLGIVELELLALDDAHDAGARVPLRTLFDQLAASPASP